MGQAFRYLITARGITAQALRRIWAALALLGMLVAIAGPSPAQMPMQHDHGAMPALSSSADDGMILHTASCMAPADEAAATTGQADMPAAHGMAGGCCVSLCAPGLAPAAGSDAGMPAFVTSRRAPPAAQVLVATIADDLFRPPRRQL